MTKTKNVEYQLAHPASVCRRIAHAALKRTHNADRNHSQLGIATVQSSAPKQLGDITLRPHQQDAVERLEHAIREFRGALLADTVGLGKTFVALALAERYEHTHVLAPAALIPMWLDAVRTTAARNVSIHSLHQLSRQPIENPMREQQSLVIIDEAHHLRTRNTIRYRNATSFTTGNDVLLLSATPLHNQTRELRNLLALFLGNRTDALDHQTLSRCIVRRTANSAHAPRIPTVVEHKPLRLPDNQMVLESLLTLPPPLPTRDGSAAGALVRLGLLRAWCSSDAALNDSIRRRQMRGEALLHSLAHDRHPTQRELQTFILGTDSVQLGFPELLVASASHDNAAMLKTLLAHLDALQSLLQLHTRTSMADARRTELLRSLVGTETLTAEFAQVRPSRSANRGPDSDAAPAIVAFSQFASTVRALHRALSDLAGVASLTSDGGRIASGPITRHELIATFAPRAHGRPPPPLHARIRLLLTTDLLAEGVNLQDAGIVVHLDLPWTDALRQQRVGRLARMGAAHSEVHVHTIEPPIGAEKALRLVAALERKAGLHRQLIGDEPAKISTTVSGALSAPDLATQLRSHFQRWMEWSHESELADGDSLAGDHLQDTVVPVVAQIDAVVDGWLCAVETDGEILIVASDASLHAGEITESDSSVRIGCELPAVFRVVNAVPVDDMTDSGQLQPKTDSQLIEKVVTQLTRWMETHELLQLTGPGLRTLSAVHKHALDQLSLCFERVNPASRSSCAAQVSDIQNRILQTRGAGVEIALGRWTQRSEKLPFIEWLNSFPQNLAPTCIKNASGLSRGSWQLVAMLILKANEDSS